MRFTLLFTKFRETKYYVCIHILCSCLVYFQKYLVGIVELPTIEQTKIEVYTIKICIIIIIILSLICTTSYVPVYSLCYRDDECTSSNFIQILLVQTNFC